MLIKNFEALATNKNRHSALTIVDAAYESILVYEQIKKRLVFKNKALYRDGRMVFEDFKNLYFLGLGKGSYEAARAFEEIAGDLITEGAVIDISGGPLKKIKSLIGTHPYPSEQNKAAAQELLKIADKAEKDDVIVAFIFGGGSALACFPSGNLMVIDLESIFREATKRGMAIGELNVIRRHLSQIHGGFLAQAAYPAWVYAFIVSDVPGNNLNIVSSGPTVFDPTTIYEAEQVAEKYHFAQLRFQETPKDPKIFEKVHNELFLSNIEAVLAMMNKAKELGFNPSLWTLTKQGEAQFVGREALRVLRKLTTPAALIGAGETTVDLINVFNPGKGGRNQEVGAGALLDLQTDELIISFASDAHDNTEAAGAVVDTETVWKAHRKGLKAEEFLNNHDIFRFFEQTNDLIFVEPLTANVSDLLLALKF
ncbi:hypothetical protein COZ81_02285 [Candidatus Jorgensenbacteria bacterium CG_4_8_14_3_um_filter_38_10]|uniref:Glycerate kinase n=1 Tax=Candidatus Jorgensenbacteria bacterium CG11_big_fil_rev_8_21_14_0_20_38_23 TaxID=1974594 RepID=A0A2H0NEM3_9BACT|nr:MAG: hypothetical protein COV54_01490 [Candidatus Jorgensenbacteria bacterium CG11_big_fil_rev_8_21_14_0_20_38_23]PIV13475.1 MAG: hypothetical protein COS46_00050 [Candidatus Jorgensenbacteria bacterium CG03_land_8_20_14_0_80_38_39]PIW97494.1 MAG: hypothetical protein COZ81_02285 [Candidatus Jorgensenbacteria bacterium CG_4_8_14_3_um_filter_38_10]PJA95253.1 MAG: hypothetical protein CO130_00160 [Candidatus Jorgensenbacteria bacterium CG_4_9_14_3_um_filter_38_10]